MKSAKEDVGKREEDLAFAAVSGIPGTKAYRNVYIPLRGGRTAEIDILLVSAKGVVAIEVKGFGGAITGSAVRWEWTRTRRGKRSGGIERLKFYNPVRQSDAHLRAVSRYLRVPLASCHGLVVFSDRAVLKKVPPSTETCTILQTKYLRGALLRRLRAHGDRFSPAEASRIMQSIESLPVLGEEEKQRHIVQTRQAEKLRMAEQERRRQRR